MATTLRKTFAAALAGQTKADRSDWNKVCAFANSYKVDNLDWYAMGVAAEAAERVEAQYIRKTSNPTLQDIRERLMSEMKNKDLSTETIDIIIKEQLNDLANTYNIRIKRDLRIEDAPLAPPSWSEAKKIELSHNRLTSIPVFGETEVFDEDAVDHTEMLDDGEQVAIRAMLKKAWGRLIFRRVSKVMTRDEDLIQTTFVSPSGFTAYAPGEEPEFSAFEEEHNVQRHYGRYALFAMNRALRNNDPFDNTGVYCGSARYGILGIDGMSPCAPQQVPPRTGDLVCMVINRSQPRRRGKSAGLLEAESWFACSEQFLRAWTLIMYDWHASFFNDGEEPRLREHSMSGNRLCTNNFKKWYLGMVQDGRPMDEEESQKRFYAIRTEALSDYVHPYAALVVMARYGELPNWYNVPNNRDDKSPKLGMWDLPQDFVENVREAARASQQ